MTTRGLSRTLLKNATMDQAGTLLDGFGGRAAEEQQWGQQSGEQGLRSAVSWLSAEGRKASSAPARPGIGHVAQGLCASAMGPGQRRESKTKDRSWGSLPQVSQRSE